MHHYRDDNDDERVELTLMFSSSKGLKKVKSGDYARVKGRKLEYDMLARASHNSICNVS